MTERKTVYINLPDAFIRGPYVNSKQIEFYNCIIPDGVTVDGKNLGGYSFTSRYASAPPDWKQMGEDGNLPRDSAGGIIRNHDAKYKQLPIIRERIKLEKKEKDREGNYNTTDTVTVTAGALREALITHQKEYRNRKKGCENE